MFRFIVAAAAACVCAGAPVGAQTVLTLEETIARAGERAGDVLVARARIAEAEAGVIEAAARFTGNPVIETAAGPRSRAGSRSTDFELSLSQQFETGGQRRARMAGAGASVDRQRVMVDAARREAAFDAATAFLDGVAARERLRLAEEGDTITRELLNSTERRYALGDIAAIDANLARIEAARSAAALRGARAELTAAAGRLRAALGMAPDEPIELRGSLDLPPPAPLDTLRAAIDERPELAALRAEARAADAEIELGRALRRPGLGVRVAYAREEAADVVLGGLTIALPAFQRGQGTLAAGAARASRARLELETRRRRAAAELETAYALYQQRSALAASLVADAAPSLDDNLDLARRSYDAGELNLMALLLVRRDALDTRAMMIDRQRDAALSRITVDYVAGVLR